MRSFHPSSCLWLRFFFSLLSLLLFLVLCCEVHPPFFLPQAGLLFTVLSCLLFLVFLQRHLLWMLPMELWQEVLGFCAFPEYARMTKLRKAVSREFYFLLKQSLLELRFDCVLPSPGLGGLWMASRDVQATCTHILHLGLCATHHSFSEGHLLFLHTGFHSPVRRQRLPVVVPGGGAAGGHRAAALPAETGG